MLMGCVSSYRNPCCPGGATSCPRLAFGVVRKRPFVMLIDYSCSEAGVRMAFLGRVLKWEKRGDYYVLKATDVLGRKLAVCFVWPCSVDEEAKAPRA